MLTQGFIGAMFSCLFFAVGLAYFLASYDYFICPVQTLSFYSSDVCIELHGIVLDLNHPCY